MRSRADGSAILVRLALLISLGAVLGLVEAVISPPIPVPGVRLGLANIPLVLAIVTLGSIPAACVALGRALLVGILAGTMFAPSTAIGIAGALAAWAVMSVAHRTARGLTPYGISAAGGAAHAVAQFSVVCLFVGSAAPLSLLAPAVLLSIVTGLFVGHVSCLLLARVPRLSASVFRSGVVMRDAEGGT